MTKVEDVRFFHCDSPDKDKGCGWTVPADISINNKFQVCQCFKCGRITKRKVINSISMRVKYHADWQKTTKRAREVQDKILKIRTLGGKCVEVLNPKVGESEAGKEWQQQSV